MKITIIGTHSSTPSGYSRVMRAIVPRLAVEHEVMVYGIHAFGNSIYNDIYEFDAHSVENEKGLKEDGFFYSGLPEFVDNHKPDVVVIYNDPVVIGNYLLSLAKATHPVKVVLYTDLVSNNIRESLWWIFSHHLVVGVMVMSKCWIKDVLSYGCKVPIEVISHFVDTKPVDNARGLAGLNDYEDDILFLNMNRNTSRKRLDIYAMAAPRYIAKHPNEKVRFLCNSHHETKYDIHSIAIREMVSRGVQDVFKQADKIMVNRTFLSDERVDVLYNACDVVVNCSSGEGFGLCSAEGAAVGKAVIISDVGGAGDYFTTNSAYKIKPKVWFSVDDRDGIGGVEGIIDVDDLVAAFEFFTIPKNRKTYGKNAQKLVKSKPSWDEIANKVSNFVNKVVK